MMNIIGLELQGVPVLPSTPNFRWDEVLQNNLNIKGYEDKDFNVIEDPDVAYNVVMHSLMMQEYRDWLGTSIVIESWYRPELYNDVVLIELGYGSTKTSDHKCKDSCATDTDVQPSTKRIDKWKEICSKYGVNWSIGLYGWGMHLGWRRYKGNRIWDNR